MHDVFLYASVFLCVVMALSLYRAVFGPTVLDRLIDDPPPGLGDELQWQARAQRLRQLLGAEGSVPNDADEATMLRIARLTDDESIVEAVLARLADPQPRMELALEHPRGQGGAVHLHEGAILPGAVDMDGVG